jgi:uncharacterized protein (DUF1697 family)
MRASGGSSAYIASGNVVLDSRAAPARVKAALEARLQEHFGKAAGVIVRTAAEMVVIVAANPFPKADPSKTAVLFLNASPPRDALNNAAGRRDEEMVLGDYPTGMGRSRLRIPAARTATARNLRTAAKLAEMTARR